MSNLLQLYRRKLFTKLTENKKIDRVSPGDLISVVFVSQEDGVQRRNEFEGRCIGLKKSYGMPGHSIIVWKVTKTGFGIKRTIPVESPTVESVTLKAKGTVARAKLYYLCALRGKSARIKTKTILDQETKDANARKKSATLAKRQARFALKKDKNQANSDSSDSKKKADLS